MQIKIIKYSIHQNLKITLCTFLIIITIIFSQLLYSQTNFWEQTNGPYTEDVLSLLITSNSYIFCGSSSHGVYRSTNNGDNWENVTNETAIVSANIMVSDSNGNIFVGDNYTRKIYRSSDNGDSWTELNLIAPSIEDIAVNSKGDIFAAVWNMKGEIFRSTNKGNSWIEADSGIQANSILCLYINSNDDIFAGTDKSIYLSTDKGEHWVEIYNGLSTSNIAIAPNGNIFVTHNGEGIYRSADNGNSWVPVNNGLTDKFVTTIKASSEGYIFAGTLSGIFRTSDNGNSWLKINNGLFYPYVNAISINSNSHIFAGTSGGGIYSSTDNGDSWTQKNQGLSNAEILTLIINSKDEIFASAGFIGVLHSTNNGDYWSPCNNGIPNSTSSLSFIINSENMIFAATDKGVFKFIDSENKWIQTNLTVRVFSLAINSEDQIFAGGFNNIFFSSDNGGTWKETNLVNTDAANALGINSKNDIFAATDRGVFRSTDNGENWVKIELSKQVYCFAFTSKNKIFAGTSNGIFYSTNNGENWTKISQFPDYYVNSILINSDDEIFAGTSGAGVFFSEDEGESWIEVNDGLSTQWISSFAINSKGYIFAGASNTEPYPASWLGVYRSTKTTTVIKDNNKNFPNNFKLFQNYPNPFNPSTTIKFDIPFRSIVNLKIYDLTGRIVKTIINHKAFNQGEYKVNWNADGYAAGVYFCRLTVINSQKLKDEHSKTLKLILLK